MKDVHVVTVESGDMAVVVVRGEEHRISLETLRAAARQDDESLSAIYGELVRQAEALVRFRADARLRAAVDACSRHAAHHTTEPRCYAGPVSRDPNPAAHGWVMYREVCRCGAERPVNQNQDHLELGSWAAPVA